MAMTPCEEEDLSIMKVKLPLLATDVLFIWTSVFVNQLQA